MLVISLMLMTIDKKYDPTSSVMTRAIAYVQALDQGKNHIEAYRIAHPNASDLTARNHTYTYRTSPQVKDAIRCYYGTRLPAWATSKDGITAKLARLDELIANDPEQVDTARKVIMDVAKIQGISTPDIVIDNRTITVDKDTQDKIVQRLKSVSENNKSV